MIGIFAIPVPAIGEGPAVNVSSLIGRKTVTLAGTFTGTYAVLGSHDNVHYIPILYFNASGPEPVKQTIDGAFNSVKIRSLARNALGVTVSISGDSQPGICQFAQLAVLPPGIAGPQPIIDLFALFPVTGLVAGLNTICIGTFSGTISIEASLDGSNFSSLGSFRSGDRQESNLGLFVNPLEFSPLPFDESIRYLRINVLTNTHVFAPVTLTLGGETPFGGIGPAGPTGTAGPTGPAGPAGTAGATGPAGADGATGPAGADGATGPAGADGATGPAGADGATGPAGADGATGPAGADGVTGATGPDGADGVTGATGPDGATGPAGADGVTGATGPAGADGVTGATGPDGADGVTGATGPDGADGVTGATGPDGATGPAGADGVTGATGPDGATGPQGNDGVTGATGPDGADGVTGATGPEGATGPQGNDGVTGATGPVGADGVTGATGPDGADGVTGATGPVGATGPGFSVVEAVTVATSAYQISPTQAAYNLECRVWTASGMSMSVYMPTMAGLNGRRIFIVTDSDYNAAVYNITVVPAGTDKINNVAGSFAIAITGSSTWLKADLATSNWEIL